MSEGLRKGWCPGALRPMMAKDGLLVRLRITGGIVPATTAAALADLAARYGNGAFDLSSRGNLQMRGVAPGCLAALQERLQRLGLLDADPAGEAVRNVLASPLAGLHAGPDVRLLAAALEARLTGDQRLHALPTKFGFLIDDASTPSLAGIAADVRFDWMPEDRRFLVGLGGTRHDAMPVATCQPGDLAETAARIALAVIGIMAARPQARRLRTLIQDLGETAVARACGGNRLPIARLAGSDADPDRLLGLSHEDGIAFLGLAAPFGRLDSAMLGRAARLAGLNPRGEIRLTPWRMLLVPIDDGPIDPTFLDGFIVDAGDPRLAAEACVGAEGCDRGTTKTRRDATALADLFGTSRALHVSGCEKGCAKASSSRVTLVGRGGRYDLVRDGRAGDPPILRGLDLAAAREAIASLLEPA